MHLPVLKKPINKLVYDWGGGRAARWWRPAALRILMYHRFLNAEFFDQQCAYIRNYYQPFSLAEAACRMRQGDPLPQNSVVVTIDDGYRDSFTTAFPVLRAYGVPATIYLATDMLDCQTPLWTFQVASWFRKSGVRDLPWRTAAALMEQMKRMPDAERRILLAELPSLLKVEKQVDFAPTSSSLTWNQAREMTRHGIDFGAHTRSHPILSQISPRAAIVDEVVGSKTRIEEELQLPVQHFCYPNGRTEDISEESVEVVRENGFLTAVTSDPGLNHVRADPYRLRRISQEPNYPESLFALRMTGFGV